MNNYDKKFRGFMVFWLLVGVMMVCAFYLIYNYGL